MKLWIDDVRPAPVGYVWCKTVNKAKEYIKIREIMCKEGISCDNIELIDLDHDAGDYAFDGGDYIKILDWMEKTARNYPIHIHSMNPVGIANMRRIIQKNGWEEISSI